MVERMRHLADQSADRFARQPGIGVERDDVADTGRARREAGRPIGMKVVSVAPRSSRFNSCSLPRLRSQPIHRPSLSFQTRRRWSSRKRSAAGPVP